MSLCWRQELHSTLTPKKLAGDEKDFSAVLRRMEKVVGVAPLHGQPLVGPLQSSQRYKNRSVRSEHSTIGRPANQQLSPTFAGFSVPGRRHPTLASSKNWRADCRDDCGPEKSEFSFPTVRGLPLGQRIQGWINGNSKLPNSLPQPCKRLC